MVNIEIPNLIYTFSNTKNNNQFKITIQNADDIYETHIITIPDGIWTIPDLINYLQLNYFNREIFRINIITNLLLFWFAFLESTYLFK